MQKITPFLWFAEKADEAVNFYTSLFPDSSIGQITYYEEGSPLPKGTIMTLNFKLLGQEFIALNGGPAFTFTPAVSFFVHCDDQKEVDYLWEKLSEGGEIMNCGWLKDKYGLTWQIIPVELGILLNDPDKQKAKRVIQAMLKMKKIEIDILQKAYHDEL